MDPKAYELSDKAAQPIIPYGLHSFFSKSYELIATKRQKRDTVTH